MYISFYNQNNCTIRFYVKSFFLLNVPLAWSFLEYGFSSSGRQPTIPIHLIRAAVQRIWRWSMMQPLNSISCKFLALNDDHDWSKWLVVATRWLPLGSLRICIRNPKPFTFKSSRTSPYMYIPYSLASLCVSRLQHMGWGLAGQLLSSPKVCIRIFCAGEMMVQFLYHTHFWAKMFSIQQSLGLWWIPSLTGFAHVDTGTYQHKLITSVTCVLKW